MGINNYRVENKLRRLFMKKSKLLVVGLIGLLMAGGLILAGCDLENCPGSGDCTVTIEQGTHGLYVDDDSPRSSCGSSATYNYDTGSYTGGCKVQNNINNHNRRYGTQSCDC